MAKAAKPTSMHAASIKDFGGGWNVADAEYNLATRFLPLADNVVIGVDNSLAPRPGYELAHELIDGVTSATVGPVALAFTSNIGGWILISIVGHPFVNGNHITISGASNPVNGVPVSELNATHGVLVIDANTIRIQTRTVPSATSAVAVTCSWTRDTHTLGGDIIEMAHFQNYIIIFSSIGEIYRISEATGVKAQIWTIALAAGTAGSPRGWSPCKHVSYDTWRQTLVAVNGRTNDKPIELDNNRTGGLNPVQYLVDPATSSNSFVYSAEFIVTHSNYTLLVGAYNPNTPSTNTPTLIEVSAAGTSGVFTGNPAPDDAVQVDVGRVTTTVDPRITGAGTIRDEVFVSFYDSSMLGKLGTYDTSGKHVPDFKDQIPQHGSLNHRVIRNIGNDLFVCDYAGIPAFSQSIQSGTIVPDRLSQLVDPAMIAHFARLSEDTLRYNAWAVFNTRDRQYMVNVPKFDSSSVFAGDEDGIYLLSDLTPYAVVLVKAAGHTVSAGDYVVVSGATAITGLAAGNINGTRRVVAVIDTASFLMTVGAVPVGSGVNGGGTAILFAPVNDENITYVYQYNPALKIKRWTRFRHTEFTAGVISRNGTMYVARDGKIFEWGTSDKAFTADSIKEWDYTWAASTAYVVGDRVKQSSSSAAVYICITDHTSSGTFATNVVDNTDDWELYVGTPIIWVAETPWSDYKRRMYKKINKYIKCDTTGRGRFKVEVFVDNIYREQMAQQLSPLETVDYSVAVVEQDFVARDVAGFGGGDQYYGLGMRTREQLATEFPFECMLAKLRISGSSTERMSIVGISILYHLGSIYR